MTFYPKKYFNFLLLVFPLFRKIRDTKGTQTPISFSLWFHQKVLGINKDAYWPVHRTSLVQGPKNILIGIETSPGLMPNCYVEAVYNTITIGDYTQIGPGVGILSSNHKLTDNRKSNIKGPVKIGKYCWLGMGSRILSGVELGDYTIVAANAVVTKSFPEGYCVLAGNPAKVVKTIPKDECVFHTSKNEYIGYFKVTDFGAYKLKNINVT